MDMEDRSVSPENGNRKAGERCADEHCVWDGSGD